MMRLLKILNCLFFYSSVYAQQLSSFIWPVDSPIVLTANYGELRPNHFHTGLDFSTGGQINKPVYAAADGYISRIKVSSLGYGKCVYITHSNGKVTVYGHLNSFGLKADILVKQEQQTQQNYEVEVLPKPFTVLVRKNEIIGLSGNTGGSTGPHVHFEIRDEILETPLNPLNFYKINDPIKPHLQALAIYSLADTTAPKLIQIYAVQKGRKDTMTIESGSLTVKESIIALAFSGFDQAMAGGSPNNIYGIKLYKDNELIYEHQLNNIDFSETRYINQFSEHSGMYVFQKCFLPTLYPKKFQQNKLQKGRINLRDTDYHKFILQCADESGNVTNMMFYLRASEINYYKEPAIKSDVFVNCNKAFFIKKNGLQLYMPAGNLYYSSPLIFENTIETTGKLILLPGELNLKGVAIVGFKVPERYTRVKQKMILKNASSVFSPIIKNDSVFFAIKSFGWFQLSSDTVKPYVTTLLGPRKIKKIKSFSNFSFIIRDISSGIGRYKTFVNNVYVPAEYDAKSDLLTFYFDEESPKGLLNLKVEVEDKVGNKTIYNTVIRR